MTAAIIALSDHRRRKARRIMISAGIFNGYDVEVTPPTVSHPLKHYRTYAEAMAGAGEIARAEQWPIVSGVPRDNDSPGPRVA